MLVEKYRPKTFEEIGGQNTALKKVISWINTWGEGKKACLIHGESGIGKTTSVHALANEMNFDIIEMNASDKRNADAIERIVGNASQTLTLSGKDKIIVLDEADNIHGNADRGGVRALAKIISETRVPILLTANEYWEISPSIRGKCKMIKFPKLRYTSIRKILREIAKKEGINVTNSQLTTLAKNVDGNLRAAINDLDTYREDIDKIGTLRDTSISIFHALGRVFKKKNCGVREEFWNIDKSPREVLLWVDENVPKVYGRRDRAEAYYMLSRADIYLARARRKRQYKLWGYAMDLMTAGVSVARTEKFKFQRFSSPTYFKKLAKTKSKRKTLQDITEKISKKCHCSTSEAKQYLFLAEELKDYFELEKDEIKFLRSRDSFFLL
ncbi:MAG: replication factor C large subunit [Euryarchaeota archaeon]|nr:replication factor C large subunit [Euryarchaeota archaeon]